jgi:hypothetical protein
VQVVPRSLKYAVVERERRYLVARLAEGVISTKEVLDRYVAGTRLRLREVRDADGTVTRKLSHKVRLAQGPAEVACTNFYLDGDGTLVAEIDDGEEPSDFVPDWLDILEDVSSDDAWTGARLAR